MPDEPAPSGPDLIAGSLQLAEALQQAGVRYALIGGLAAGYRTHPRFTRDIDFLLQVPQLTLPSLLEELSRRGFNLDPTVTIREWTREHMTTLSYRGIRVDWLKPVIPIYQHVLDRATEETWLNRPIRVASAEGLILIKLLAYRTQDRLDIENLVAAHRDTLDLAWIRSEWETVAAADDPRMVWLVGLLVGRE
jgi:Nucleotidyl transferase AbiEii toxin, Type IV TA system